jgi:hypothetical protein
MVPTVTASSIGTIDDGIIAIGGSSRSADICHSLSQKQLYVGLAVRIIFDRDSCSETRFSRNAVEVESSNNEVDRGSKINYVASKM